MDKAIEAAEQTVEDIVEDVEEIFLPKPGGMIDRHRQERARKAAAEREAENIAERVEEPSYKGVKTAPMSPQVFQAITYTIPAGGTQQILPLNPYRVRATLLVATAASSVVLAKDSGAALGGVGFTLPTGIPLVLQARAQLYATNLLGSSVQVCVISEAYAPEK